MTGQSQVEVALPAEYRECYGCGDVANIADAEETWIYLTSGKMLCHDCQ